MKHQYVQFLFKQLGQNSISFIPNHIGGIMVSMFASNAVDSGFQPRSGKTKDYKIGTCYFSTKHAGLRRKSKDWIARNKYNVSEWCNMSTHGLLFHYKKSI